MNKHFGLYEVKLVASYNTLPLQLSNKFVFHEDVEN